MMTKDQHIADLSAVVGQLYDFIRYHLDPDPAPIGAYITNDLYRIVAEHALRRAGVENICEAVQS